MPLTEVFATRSLFLFVLSYSYCKITKIFKLCEIYLFFFQQKRFIIIFIFSYKRGYFCSMLSQVKNYRIKTYPITRVNIFFSSIDSAAFNEVFPFLIDKSTPRSLFYKITLPTCNNFAFQIYKYMKKKQNNFCYP